MENEPIVGRIVRMDGQDVECPKLDGESWADAIDRTILAIPVGRTVTGVLLNGIHASRADLEGLNDAEFCLDVQTEALVALMRDVLSDLVLHLDSLMVVFQEIGNNLRRGNLSVVFCSPGQDEAGGGVYMRGLEGIVAAQILVEEVGRIERHSGGDSFRLSFIEEQDKIEAVLSSMLKCQESQDWILLADLVEYEILPILQRGRIKASRMMGSVMEQERKERLVVA